MSLQSVHSHKGKIQVCWTAVPMLWCLVILQFWIPYFVESCVNIFAMLRTPAFITGSNGFSCHPFHWFFWLYYPALTYFSVSYFFFHLSVCWFFPYYTTQIPAGGHYLAKIISITPITQKFSCKVSSAYVLTALGLHVNLCLISSHASPCWKKGPEFSFLKEIGWDNFS